MKKTLVILIMTSVLLCGCSSSSRIESTQISTKEDVKIENPDFRNCKWGMTKEDVKKYESDIEIIEEKEDEIQAKAEINNTTFLIGYYFNNDKLEQVFMASMEEHSNENLYIDDYESFQELISKKYGEPKQDEQIWSDDLYKDKPSDWGFAISLGDLTMVSQWFTNTTEIGLTLSGDNYEIIFGIVYRDINYEKVDDTSGI